MSLRREFRKGARASKSQKDLLQNVYMASTSTIYGGNPDDYHDDESDDEIPLRRTSPPLLHTTEAHKLRTDLRYYFMNPIQKWRTRRRFPWKFLVQITKLVLVTSQLVLYSEDSMYHHSYRDDTRTTLSHLFLKGWKTTDEVLSYPPAGGPMAVYKQSEFYEYFDYAIANFGRIKHVSMTRYNYKFDSNGSAVPSSFCVRQNRCDIKCLQRDKTLGYNDGFVMNCINIPPTEANKTDWSLQKFLETQKFSINFRLLLQARFHFFLHAFRLRVKLPYHYPDCHLLNSTLVLDNKIGGSQMLVNLNLDVHSLKCHGKSNLAHTRKTTKVWRIIVDVSGLIACLLSTALCSRSLYRARLLKKKTSKFFDKNIGRPLTSKENWEFVNLWYVMICIDDILLIVGLFIKLSFMTDTHTFVENLWSICAICLGVGNFLAWIGILRYLGFFETYNVMILTLKKCVPNVLRLLICILLIFFGYTFTGWLILGPYHFKFQTFLSSMECLYSLINGDDMYASFFSTSGLDPIIWYFSRVYLYSFISLFMWIILSTFLAVIMDAYETIKCYYEEGFPRTGLMKFVSECSDKSVSRDTGGRERTLHDTINSLCCCVQSKQRKSNSYQKIP